MQDIRIVEIPKMKVVLSGPITNEKEFMDFGTWWTNYDKSVKGKLVPRDFMWYNEKINAREWIYTLPNPEINRDYGGYKTKIFPFGLYAVASCIDADCDEARDWLETKKEIEDWVNNSECFALSTIENDQCERYPMFHIISPEILYEKMGIRQEDLYVPIIVKEK